MTALTHESWHRRQAIEQVLTDGTPDELNTLQCLFDMTGEAVTEATVSAARELAKGLVIDERGEIDYGATSS